MATFLDNKDRADFLWKGVNTQQQQTFRHFEGREAYREYLVLEKGAFDPFTQARAGLVLGDEAFLRRIRQTVLKG